MRKVWVAGASMTRMGRLPAYDYSCLSLEAARGVLGYADLKPGHLGAVFSANAYAGLLSGQESIRAQVFLRDLPLPSVAVRHHHPDGRPAGPA